MYGRKQSKKKLKLFTDKKNHSTKSENPGKNGDAFALLFIRGFYLTKIKIRGIIRYIR